MRQNLEQTGGLYFSEAVMLTLVQKGMARQAAYELVQRSALRAATAAAAGEGASASGWRTIPTWRPLSAEDRSRLRPRHHLRHAGAIIDRALRDRDH